MTYQLRVERLFAAMPEEVFDAYTEPLRRTSGTPY